MRTEECDTIQTDLALTILPEIVVQQEGNDIQRVLTVELDNLCLREKQFR
jgi:hypothetical protein